MSMRQKHRNPTRTRANTIEYGRTYELKETAFEALVHHGTNVVHRKGIETRGLNALGDSRHGHAIHCTLDREDAVRWAWASPCSAAGHSPRSAGAETGRAHNRCLRTKEAPGLPGASLCPGWGTRGLNTTGLPAHGRPRQCSTTFSTRPGRPDHIQEDLCPLPFTRPRHQKPSSAHCASGVT
jgi:hypothetical protein